MSNDRFLKVKETIYKVINVSTTDDYTTLQLKTKEGKGICDLISSKEGGVGYFRNDLSRIYHTVGAQIDMIKDVETANGF